MFVLQRLLWHVDGVPDRAAGGVLPPPLGAKAVGPDCALHRVGRAERGAEGRRGQRGGGHRRKGGRAGMGEPGRHRRVRGAGQRGARGGPRRWLQERQRPLLLRLRRPWQGRPRGRRHRGREAAGSFGRGRRRPAQRAAQSHRGGVPEDRFRHLPGARRPRGVRRLNGRRRDDGPGEAGALRGQRRRLPGGDREVQHAGQLGVGGRGVDRGSQARPPGREGAHRVERRRRHGLAGRLRRRRGAHEGLGQRRAGPAGAGRLPKSGRRRGPCARRHRGARGHSAPVAGRRPLHVDSHGRPLGLARERSGRQDRREVH
mmetsp:Transcript_21914/g.61663  ORF Transcript_21914/g.61663 Transcript_21914/m.61663 type:complete len:315 (+) Transcript_21914:190-1134(+)